MLSIRSSLLLALLGSALAAHAAPTVIDGSFEDTPLSGGNYAYVPTGTAWTYTYPSGLGNGGTPWHDAAQDGDQYAFIQSASGTAGGILGTISGLTVGQSYNLSFYLGTRAGYAVNPLDVLVGSVAIATNVAPADTATGTGWTKFTYGFTATSATTGLAFQSSVASFGDLNTTIDHISVQPVSVATVPGPSALAVFGLGVLRRRRKA